jgi:hypothetical protein
MLLADKPFHKWLRLSVVLAAQQVADALLSIL